MCLLDEVMVIVSIYIFFNDTATTEIYTYGHTLSLHDALPSSLRSGIKLILHGTIAGDLILEPGARAIIHGTVAGRICNEGGRAEIFGRSEEHTSELQSLMRISYAVFCFKKKIHVQAAVHQHHVASDYHNITGTMQPRPDVNRLKYKHKSTATWLP